MAANSRPNVTNESVTIHCVSFFFLYFSDRVIIVCIFDLFDTPIDIIL